MAKILVLDNYDSFTYNLVQYVNDHSKHHVDVILNDEVILDKADKYDGFILSPGPGIPVEAGLLMPLIKKFSPTKRIFGVCLGQQAIAEVFGGKLINLNSVFHGVSTPVKFCEPQHYLFEGIPATIEAGRYHSWIVDESSLPGCLKPEAYDKDGSIMALSHRTYDVCSVQFHPESVLTPFGRNIITNWLNKF
ncbi:MAG TPA: aminodeoxychorismate/anthranilate synthase component II [Bacteroidales bacterium]|nr:aminodeoxychorismate/anthranilate synthase component II [Bacteroidales bacterium]